MIESKKINKKPSATSDKNITPISIDKKTPDKSKSSRKKENPLKESNNDKPESTTKKKKSTSKK